MNEAFCQKLDPSDPTIEKTCHFVEGQCKDIYEKCSSYTGDDEDTCLAISPLKTEEGNAFTKIYKCVFNDATTPKCKSERKKCSDYNGDSSLCPSLLSQDTNKECFFDGTDCIEKYKTCQLYFNSLSAEDKTKEKCINFRPLSQAHNCIWEELAKPLVNVKNYIPNVPPIMEMTKKYVLPFQDVPWIRILHV